MRSKQLTRILAWIFTLYTLHLTLYTGEALCASKGNPPVAHWRFDESGGPYTYDDNASSPTHRGTLNAGATGSNTAAGHMWYPQGKLGGCLEFDGDDHVECEKTNLEILGDITLEAWIKRAVNGVNHNIIRKGDWAVYEMRISSGDKLQFGHYTPSESVTSIGSVLAGEWHHVVVTRSSGNVSLYIDGKLDNTGTTVNDTDPHNEVLVIGLGHHPPFQTPFNGLIDDVRVYNYARTADQVLVDYNAGSAAHLGAGTDPNEGNPPIAYYAFDENTGTTAYDRSGNNNNGTFSGSPAFTYGKYGTCVKFPTDGDYINAPQSSTINFGTSDFSMVSWVNIPKPVTLGSGIFGRYAHNTSYNGCFVVGIGDDTTSLFFHHRNTSGSIESYNINYSLYFSKWAHMAWVKSGTKLYLYLNGQLIQSWTPGISFDVTFANGGNYMISNTGWSPGTMTNLMVDDHKLYNYARTQAQIAYDYNRGAPVAQYKFDEGGGAIAHNEYSQAGSGGVALVGWWRMDEASWNGTANEVVDSSGNANHGTAAGGATKATTTASSKIGPYAGNFDGTDDYMTRATSSVLQNNYFTIEAWVYNTRSTPQTGYGDTVFHLDDTGGGNVIVARFSPQAGTQTSNKIEFWWAGGTSSHVLTTSYSSNTWYHLAYVKDSAGAKIYVNGANVLSEADNTTVNYTNARNISIGQDQDGGSPSDFFQGRIDDVRIYNYARSAEQVYNDYKNTHGTLVGDTKFVDGKIGKALLFDGTGDYVDCGSDSNLQSKTITLESWINISSFPGQYMSIIDKRTSGNVGGYILDVIPSTNKANLFIYTTGWNSIAGNTTLLTNTWYHIAGVYDGSQMKIYVNGILDESNNLTGDIGTTSAKTYIGSSLEYGDQYFYGKIDDTRIYNYARTADQIMQDYNSGAARLGAQSAGIADPWGGVMPVAHWKLDENTGVLAKDASGNGNNGTLTNGPTWAQGKIGLAVSFDGGDDEIDIPHNSNLNMVDAGTFIAWVNQTAKGYVADKHGDSGWVGWAFSTSGGIWNGSVWYSSNMPDYSVDTWRMVGYIRDGTSVKFIDNGRVIDAGTLANPPSGNTNSFDIGDFGSAQKIDDVKIYNYARTQAQITWDYNQGKPVGQWRFDEATSGAVSTSAGAIKDESDNNNDGTASNTTWTYATGKFGGALSFDGNDYVSVTDGANSCFDFGTANFTLSVWVKTSMGATGDWVGILSKFTTNNFWIQLNPDNKYVGFGWDGANYLTSSKSVNDGNWHHIVGVRTGETSGAIYVDGVKVLESSSLPNNNLTDNTEIRIGSLMAGTPRYLIGQIDDVRIYNYARTADQIQQDYLNGAAARLGD